MAMPRGRRPSIGNLSRIESECLKLSAPFSRWIAEPLDADAAGQATFYGCFDKIGCEKGERDGHIDLPNAALLARAKLSDRGFSTRDHIIQEAGFMTAPRWLACLPCPSDRRSVGHSTW